MITLNMKEKNKGITISDKAFSLENNIVTLQIKVMDGDAAYDLTGKTITASFDKTGIETGALSMTNGLIQMPITNNLIKAGYNLIQLNFRWDTDKWEQSPVMTWNIHSSIKTTDISKQTPDFQLAENGKTRWHVESVGGVLNLVESGVLERLIISGNDANLQANLKVRKFGCNGKTGQASVALNSALSTDITTVDATALNATNALLNQIRTALINCGICT